jgi:hypothetical protein
MSLRAYRLARSSILDAARRRRTKDQTLRDALGVDDTHALLACRLVSGLGGQRTRALFSKLGKGQPREVAH